MDILGQLDENQKKVVLETEGPIRVIAGAGSGKTRALTSRYAYLVHTYGVSPSHICSVTFTNKAAFEMKKRVEKMIGSDNYSYIQTFHSLATLMLKEDIKHLNYPSNFNILDESDQKMILNEIYQELNLTMKDNSFRTFLELIEIYKQKNQTEYITYLTAPSFILREDTQDKEMNLINRYLAKQRRNYLLDFDDLIYFCNYLLRNNHSFYQKWATNFEYIMVDEFQDVSEDEYEFVSLLSGVHHNLMVVGDPDQTIYSWRGSDVTFILDFPLHFEGTKTFLLDTNYRSLSSILTVANEVIKKNQLRFEKDLKTSRGEGEMPKVFYEKNRKLEAYRIIKEIQQIGKTDSYREIAILYRANYLSRGIEEALIAEGIPYQIYSGVEFYQRKEIKDCLSYLRMVTRPDDLSFERTISNPSRNIGKKRLSQIKKIAEQEKISYLDALRKVQDLPFMKGTKVKEYLDLIDRFKENDFPLPDLLDQLLKDSGYESMIMLSGDQERLNNINELKDSLKDYDLAVDDYLKEMALVSNIDQSDKKESVKLMTIHTAKGLEFKNVFIISMNEGVFPSAKIKENLALEEERRLFYVAITRASDQLFLSASQGNEDSKYLVPSRFFSEMGLENLDIISNKQAFLEDLSLRKEIEESIYDEFSVGDKVIHAIFGLGTIEQVLDKEYVVMFEKFQTPRSIIKSYPFQKINS